MRALCVCLKAGEEVSRANSWGKAAASRRTSKCKAPEEEMALIWFRVLGCSLANHWTGTSGSGIVDVPEPHSRGSAHVNECWLPGLDARTARCPYRCCQSSCPHSAASEGPSCFGTAAQELRPPTSPPLPPWPHTILPGPLPFQVGGLDICQGALMLSGAIS